MSVSVSVSVRLWMNASVVVVLCLQPIANDTAHLTLHSTRVDKTALELHKHRR